MPHTAVEVSDLIMKDNILKAFEGRNVFFFTNREGPDRFARLTFSECSGEYSLHRYAPTEPDAGCLATFCVGDIACLRICYSGRDARLHIELKELT